MPLVAEKFDQNKIDSLRRYLQREKEKGRPKDYEISVDGFKVVSRTDNVDEFDDYEDDIKPDTRNLTIAVYEGNGNRNTKYSFMLKGEPEEQAAKTDKTVNGLGEVDRIVQEALKERDKDHEIEKLREELEDTQVTLAETEELCKSLQNALTEVNGKNSLATINYAQLLSEFCDKLIKKNVHKIPALAGLLGPGENPNSAPAEQSESYAGFEKAGDAHMDEDTRNRVNLIAQIQQQVKGKDFEAVWHILDQMLAHQELIPQIIQFLNAQIKS